jgi:hypothetical protein
VFSLSFLLLGAHAWQSYVETERVGYLPLTAVLMFLGALSKESYVVAVGVFWVSQVLLLPRHRKAAIVMLIASGLSVGLAVERAFSWTRASGAAYETGVGFVDILNGIRMLGRLLFFKALIAALLAIIAVGFRRDRSVSWIALACIVLAIASLVPNAALRNHLYNHYSFLGLLFASAPILLIGRLTPRHAGWYAGVTMLAVTIYAVLIHQQQWNIAHTSGWQRDQEQMTRRLVGTLKTIREQVSRGDRILVAGITGPFSPFFAPAYIGGEICSDCHWTVVVPSSVPEDPGMFIERAHPANPRVFADYDRMFVIAPDGSLAGSYKGGEIPLRQQGWQMPDGRRAEIHAGAPNGPIVAPGPSGSAEPSDSVRDGMVFFLQDASQGDATRPERTKAIVVMSVSAANGG